MPKIEHFGLTKDANEMGKGVDPDQSVSFEAI